MRWAGHVAHIGETRKDYRILVMKSEGKGPFGRNVWMGRIIVKCILEKWTGRAWTGLILFRIRTRTFWCLFYFPNNTNS